MVVAECNQLVFGSNFPVAISVSVPGGPRGRREPMGPAR